MLNQDLNEENALKLRRLVQEKIDNREITQTDLARRIGMSAPAVSAWIKGRYEGNVSALNEKINKYFNFEEEQKQLFKPVQIPFVETTVSETVKNYAKLVQMDNEIGVVYGASGLGKTTALKDYAKNMHGVIILEPDEDCHPTYLIEELYDKLGCGGQTRSVYMKKEIISRLKESNRLIIVDEAENLMINCFKALRKLHDKTDCTFGLLFVGTHRLYHNLLKLQGDFEYLTNRIGYSAELKKLTEKDVKSIVKTVLPDDEAADIYWQKTDGNARILTKTIKRSVKLATANKIAVNAKIITQCRNMLIA